MKSKFLVVLALFLSTTTWAGISGQLMQIAATHPGHSQLENHNFILLLKSGTFDEYQIAQFFTDRIYILGVMENFLVQGTPELQNTEFEDFPTFLKIFFRSHGYTKELQLLRRSVNKALTLAPSQEAIQYGAYLKSQDATAVFVHIWLFLVGETFGTQSMAQSIEGKFNLVGNSFRSFENLTLTGARGVYNSWINEKVNQDSLDIHAEVKVGFDYMIQLFDAALYSSPPFSCTLF